MFNKLMLVLSLMFFSITVVKAGSVVNGVWSPGNCGIKQPPPVIDQSSIDAYNKSIKTVNEWQHVANGYMTCLINEANADNALIAKVANDEQANFRAEVEKIKTETEAAKQKLDKQ